MSGQFRRYIYDFSHVLITAINRRSQTALDYSVRSSNLSDCCSPQDAINNKPLVGWKREICQDARKCI